MRLPNLATEYPDQFSRRGEFRMSGSYAAFLCVAPATRELLEYARRTCALQEVTLSVLEQMISFQENGFIGLLSLTTPNIFALRRLRITRDKFHSLVYNDGWTHDVWNGPEVTPGMRFIG